MPESAMAEIAYILTLVGGVLLIIFGLLSITGYPGQYYGEVLHWGFAYSSVVAIICGIIAIIGSRSVPTLAWAIVLIIFGILGGGFGGLLVVIGGLIGLIIYATGGNRRYRR
jgi:hypothetical protein